VRIRHVRTMDTGRFWCFEVVRGDAGLMGKVDVDKSLGYVVGGLWENEQVDRCWC
jgi:hypothetical protein